MLNISGAGSLRVAMATHSTAASWPVEGQHLAQGLVLSGDSANVASKAYSNPVVCSRKKDTLFIGFLLCLAKTLAK